MSRSRRPLLLLRRRPPQRLISSSIILYSLAVISLAFWGLFSCGGGAGNMVSAGKIVRVGGSSVASIGNSLHSTTQQQHQQNENVLNIDFDNEDDLGEAEIGNLLASVDDSEEEMSSLPEIIDEDEEEDTPLEWHDGITATDENTDEFQPAAEQEPEEEEELSLEKDDEEEEILNDLDQEEEDDDLFLLSQDEEDELAQVLDFDSAEEENDDQEDSSPSRTETSSTTAESDSDSSTTAAPTLSEAEQLMSFTEFSQKTFPFVLVAVGVLMGLGVVLLPLLLCFSFCGVVKVKKPFEYSEIVDVDPIRDVNSLPE